MGLLCLKMTCLKTVNTLSRFLTLFIACSDNVCFIYRPAYTFPMLYKTVQCLSVCRTCFSDYMAVTRLRKTYESMSMVQLQ